MKVKQLIEALSKLPPDDEVIIAKDAEGNSYSPLDVVCGDLKYDPQNTWSGSCYGPEDCDEFEPREWASMKNAVALWPVN